MQERSLAACIANDSETEMLVIGYGIEGSASVQYLA